MNTFAINSIIRQYFRSHRDDETVKFFAKSHHTTESGRILTRDEVLQVYTDITISAMTKQEIPTKLGTRELVEPLIPPEIRVENYSCAIDLAYEITTRVCLRMI